MFITQYNLKGIFLCFDVLIQPGGPFLCFDPAWGPGTTGKVRIGWPTHASRATRKGLVKKEGERVARGHFHERVGESLRRYKNFGTSGSPVAFFVSEIRPFENFLGSKSNFK